MQRGVAQHVARYGGNVGTETWPFWLDVQVSFFLLLMVQCNLSCLEAGLSEPARADCAHSCLLTECMLSASVLLLCVVCKQLASCWLGLCMGACTRASVCLWQLGHAHMDVPHLLRGKSLCPVCNSFAVGQKVMHTQHCDCPPVEVQMCIVVVYAGRGGSNGQHSSKLPHQDGRN